MSRAWWTNWLAEVKLNWNWSGVLPRKATRSCVSNSMTRFQQFCTSSPAESAWSLARSRGRQHSVQINRSGPRGGEMSRQLVDKHAPHRSSSGQR